MGRWAPSPLVGEGGGEGVVRYVGTLPPLPGPLLRGAREEYRGRAVWAVDSQAVCRAGAAMGAVASRVERPAAAGGAKRS